MFSHHRGAQRPRAASAERPTSARLGGMAHGERGETLVEVAVSVMLMGIVITAVLTGLFTLITMSDQQNEQTKVGAALQTYAEQFKQPLEELEYIPCGGANEAGFTNYQDALDATRVAGVFDFNDDGYDDFEGKYDVSFEVTHWRGGDSFGACPATDMGLQRIEITVSNTRTGRTHRSESLTITKRDQTCPEVEYYDNQDAGPC